MNVVKNVDVHKNLSILKNDKHSYFVGTPNVFLLGVISHMLGCVSETLRGEYLRPDSEWERKRKREKLSSCIELYVASWERGEWKKERSRSWNKWVSKSRDRLQTPDLVPLLL